MVDGTATLVVDLGNSDTRVITQFGVNGKGKPRKSRTTLSNRFGTLPENMIDVYLTNQLYSEEDSSIFRFGGEYWCNGAICMTEATATTERPTAMRKKYNSLATKLAIINAFRQGYMDIAEFADCDLNSVNVNWNVTLLLPPEDVDLGSKQLADLTREIKEIDFIIPALHKQIEINSVNIFSEGFCAYIAVLFESKKKIRKSYAYLAQPSETTLIIDIGAGTTDFTIAEGGSIVMSSRFTKPIGGNNVHRRVGSALKAKGINLPESAVRTGTETGVIRSGSKEFDIKEEIAAAKKDVSKQLVDAIVDYFESTMYNIQSINHLLLVGGGSIESDVEGIEPIAHYMTEFITDISPNVSRVALPKDEEGNTLSPRLLNVIGASILSE